MTEAAEGNQVTDLRNPLRGRSGCHFVDLHATNGIGRFDVLYRKKHGLCKANL